tara:strand:+ start:679 stop:819 length:141 start_codon:yes stop_codon:yes gene_type:complete
MSMIKTRHGEATLLWIAENKDGQMEVVFQIEEPKGFGYKRPTKNRD